MQNRWTNFTFSFFPSLLAKEAARLERKYKELDNQLMGKRIKVRLPRLLEIIRALPMDEREIKRFARDLGKLDLRMLAQQYPYQMEDEMTVKKINVIMKYRYASDIGRIIWGLFQTHYKHWAILDLLWYIFNVEDENFLELDHPSRQDWNRAFQRGSFPDTLVSTLVDSKEPAEFHLRRWQVKEGSRLEKMLIFRMLMEGLPRLGFVHQTGTGKILEWLEIFKPENYKALIKVYLEARNYQQFDSAILEHALERIGDPEKNEKAWDFLSREALQEVRIWLKQREMKSFFAEDPNNERFQYWRKYLKNIHLDRLQNPPILFMDFGSFVVIEFGRVGNAAYLYHKEGYEAFILPELKYRRHLRLNEGIFKTMDEERRGIPLFITKINHHGGWQLKADSEIHRLTNRFGKGGLR